MSNIEINPVLQEHLDQKEIKKIASDLCVMVYSDRTLSDGRLEEMLEHIEVDYKDVYKKLIEECDETRFPRISRDKKLVVELNEDTFANALFALENNFCFERIEDIKILGKKLYGKPEQKPKVNTEEKVQQRSSEQPKQMQKKVEQSLGKSKRPTPKKKNQVGLTKIVIGVAVVVVVIAVISLAIN